ncbi:MAG: hypothetical protein ACXIVQ_12125 [Acidimicrobiales bacterium]
MTDHEPIVPDVIEPLRAYRLWTIDPDQPTALASTVFDTPWPTSGPMVATCRRTHHIPPWVPKDVDTTCPSCPSPPAYHGIGTGWPIHVGHGCGVYGLRRPAQVLQHQRTAGHWVAGEIAMSGKYFEYSNGYRAARAHPVALWVPPPERYGTARYADHDTVETLADTYQIPTSAWPDIDDTEVPRPGVWFFGGGPVATAAPLAAQGIFYPAGFARGLAGVSSNSSSLSSAFARMNAALTRMRVDMIGDLHKRRRTLRRYLASDIAFLAVATTAAAYWTAAAIGARSPLAAAVSAAMWWSVGNFAIWARRDLAELRRVTHALTHLDP